MIFIKLNPKSFIIKRVHNQEGKAEQLFLWDGVNQGRLPVERCSFFPTWSYIRGLSKRPTALTSSQVTLILATFEFPAKAWHLIRWSLSL